MLVQSFPRLSPRALRASSRASQQWTPQRAFLRSFSHDERNRLTNFWVPTGGITPKDGEGDDTHALLVRAGFLRQAHSGIFHLLPLGLRVQEKFERLIDKHMRRIGASKVSLSSISSEDLWRRTGRLEGKELLRLKDRNDLGLLLGPTHEEEITQLVRNTIKSYKDLPLRLYQISRKYRDELRPRQGLLRAKEFLMKDLYTFDCTEAEALETYKAARQAYVDILTDLKVPYLVAEADSGAIGGDLSHEYHFISPKGEDTLYACNSCHYVANEEVAEHKDKLLDKPGPIHVWKGISKDRNTLIEAHIMLDPDEPLPDPVQPADLINLHAIKAIFPDLDTTVDHHNAEALWPSSSPSRTHLIIADQNTHALSPPSTSTSTSTTYHPLTPTRKPHSLRALSSTPTPPCPTCQTGTLTPHRAIEIGHTFHLGTRYSAPLSLALPSPASNGSPALVHMGCHGIGVSRIMSAVADALSSPSPSPSSSTSPSSTTTTTQNPPPAGLTWPRAVAPFEAVVIAAADGRKSPLHQDAEAVYDALAAHGVDAVLDDRAAVGMGWKLGDADLVGYSVVVVLGRAWRKGEVGRRRCEVQCRRLGVKEEVEEGEVVGFVGRLLGRL